MKKNEFTLDNITPYLMLMPVLCAIIMIQIYPSIKSIQMSFFDISLLRPNRPFVGLENYKMFFKDSSNIRVLINTFFWTVISVSVGMALALLIATQLNKSFKGKGFFRSIFLAPWVTPPVIIAAIWKLILNRDLSPINAILMKLDIIDSPFAFLADSTLYLGFLSKPMIFLIIINLWTFLPFAIVMFLSGLQTIPLELYEASTIDGASKPRQFIHITIPMLIPVMEITVLLQCIWQFNNFNLSYLVTRGGPQRSTELIAVRVYTEVMNNFNYGYGAAISVIMLLVVLVPAILYVKKAMSEENSYI